MDKDRYNIYLSSEDSKDLHPQNKVTDFVVELPEALELHGEWEVGLFQMSYRVPRTTEGPYYLFCDLCEESLVYGHQLPVLQKLTSRSSYTNPLPLYVGVKALTVQRIHIRLTDIKFKNLQLDSDNVECVLILRRAYK